MQPEMAGSGSESEAVIVGDGMLIMANVWRCGNTMGSISWRQEGP